MSGKTHMINTQVEIDAEFKKRLKTLLISRQQLHSAKLV